MKTIDDVEHLRNNYRPIARRGTILYFALSEMSAVNPMYQFSLKSFVEVFNRSLNKALPNDEFNQRIINIIHSLTECVYSYGCIG